MKCITHNDVDAVANCVKCGAGLCRECVKNTIFEENKNPFCLGCNYTTATENASVFQARLREKKISIVICSIALVTGLIIFALGKLFYLRIGNLHPIFAMILCWSIGGLIDTIVRGLRNYDDIFGKILGFFIGGLFMPYFLIMSLIGLFRVKRQIVHNNKILSHLKFEITK